MSNPPKHYRRIEGSERSPQAGAKRLGPTNDTNRFEVTIVLRRRADGPAVPDHAHYLTPPAHRRRQPTEAFAKKYGAAGADIDEVVDFVKSHGLTVEAAHPARRIVLVTGTVAQFNKAFAIALHDYEHHVARRRGEKPRPEIYRDHDGFVHAPEKVADAIVGVFGLENRRITKRNLGDPPATTPIAIQNVTQLYQFPVNLAAGQTIAIFSEGGYLPSDISSNFGGNPPVVIEVNVDATNGNFADAETTQDIFIAGSAAPGAEIAVYFTTYDQKGWVDLVSRVVHPQAGDPVCSVLSSSFYVSNGDDAATLNAEGISPAWVTAVTQAFEDAAIQGVTICIASGDTGSESKVPDGKAHVQYPASDPWVLSVGGTTIGNVSGASFDEYAWTDSFSFGGFSGVGATGGGVSDYFPQPYYQVDASVPPSLNDGHRGRGVPDVSANASPNSGYPIILGGNPSPFPANGTSASAPLWAGLVAVINAAMGENLGFVNPAFYALGSTGFRDIQPHPGASDNGMAGTAGYPVTSGWDACTGLGSPIGIALLQGLRSFFGPTIAVTLQDALQFGTLCTGPRFLTMRVFNVGNRTLMILSVTRVSGSTDFSIASGPVTPVGIAPGSFLDFTIEYAPTVRGVAAIAKFQITSNDPTEPTFLVKAHGMGGTGSLRTIVADSGYFGKACVGSFVDRDLMLNNNGPCSLSITGVTSSSPEFLTPGVSQYPLVVAAGDSIRLPIRFQPATMGAKSATLTVQSDDPQGPQTVAVSGAAPAGKLALGGSAHFGEVDCGVAERTISVCNVGDCDLHVTRVAFRRERRRFAIVNNPFPATLPRGSCLAVVVQYTAGCEPEPCELVIDSDDPAEPVKAIDVVAYTRCYKPCKKDCECERCREKCCEHPREHRA